MGRLPRVRWMRTSQGTLCAMAGSVCMSAQARRTVCQLTHAPLKRHACLISHRWRAQGQCFALCTTLAWRLKDGELLQRRVLKLWFCSRTQRNKAKRQTSKRVTSRRG